MAVEFRIVRGARTGAKERFEKSVVSIGRHPMNDLRFDAAKDVDASSRHAELRTLGTRHMIHDLGSTNGTFVNGERIDSERELADGDTVSFGVEGPQVTFHILPAHLTAELAPPKTAGYPSAPRPAPKKNTEVRIAEAVKKQTGKMKQMIIALAVIVVASGAVAAWFISQAAESQRRQFEALLAANDSLARALEQRLEQTGVADAALREARAESERLARELRAQNAAGGDVAALSAQMRSAQLRTSTIARMDYSAVTSANKAAIVFVAVQMPDGSASSGTGFNILPSGLVVTNKHVVESRTGIRARRVGVLFEGTQGEWRPATIEYVSETDELALLRIDRPGHYPTVAGIARDAGDVKLGDPVALLGYPLGTGTAGNERGHQQPAPRVHPRRRHGEQDPAGDAAARRVRGAGVEWLAGVRFARAGGRGALRRRRGERRTDHLLRAGGALGDAAAGGRGGRAPLDGRGGCRGRRPRGAGRPRQVPERALGIGDAIEVVPPLHLDELRHRLRRRDREARRRIRHRRGMRDHPVVEPAARLQVAQVDHPDHAVVLRQEADRDDHVGSSDSWIPFTVREVRNAVATESAGTSTNRVLRER